MKAMKKLVSAVLAMACGIGLAVPVGVSAEGLFPGDNLTTTIYSSADINRNGSVEIMDSIAVSRYLIGHHFINSPQLMDADRNHIVSKADLQAVTAKVVEMGYTNEVDGLNHIFGTIGTTMTYTATESTTYQTFYRHNTSNGTSTANDTSYALSITDEPIPTNMSSPDTVIGDPDFYPETDSDLRSGICLLSNNATGFVVGDHMIATAAHNCFVKLESGNSQWRGSMTVRFPISGQVVSSSPTYTVTQYHVDKAFYDHRLVYNSSYTDPIIAHDYALLIVDADLSDRYHFSLGVPYNMYNYSNFASYNLYVSGYPNSDVPNPSQMLYTAYGQLYTNNSVTPSVLRYTTDTVAGNSGSPIYVKECYTTGNSANTSNIFTVIGIHDGGYKDKPALYNSGCYVTPMMLKFYYNNSHCS